MTKSKLAPDPRKCVKPLADIQFITFKISCYSNTDIEKEPISLEISPLAVLVAASIIHEVAKKGPSLEDCMAEAFINVIESVEEQFTILGVSHK